MNHAVTLGVKKVDGKPVYTVITDPNTPHSEQRRAIKQLRRKLHVEYDEVQLWTSSAGRVKKVRTTSDPLPQVGVRSVESEASAEETVPDGADLLNTDAPAAQEAPAAQNPDNSGEAPVTSPAPDKKAAALAKARAAAAKKKAAKAQQG